MSKYTPEQKAEALLLLADGSQSYAEIRDTLQIPVGTLSGWAKAAGIVHTGERKNPEEARAIRMTRIAERRDRLKEKLVRYAEGFADKASRSSAPRDAKVLIEAAAIALDKFRLEMGEATQVTEQRGDAVPKARSKVDELADRRAQKTA